MSSPPSAASNGRPAGSTGVSATAITAPVPAATRDGRELKAGRASASITAGAVMLASDSPGTRRDIYRVTAEPGVGHLACPHAPGTVEHVVLGAGRALVGPEGEAVELGPGDYVRYPGDVPHVFDALAPRTLGIFVMEHV